jgi:Tol biopolymer transport system component
VVHPHPEAAALTLAPGIRLGPYEVVAPLGAGGMGEVWRARDARLGREVAIKSLPVVFAQDPERLARFEREARLLASLSHPNIAGIHGLELVEGQRYLVLEFVEGETLAARLERGPLPLGEAIEIARQIASGVEAAHDSGVVHRDLKPGNVMLRPDGAVKVLDFGLAKGSAAHGASGSDPNLSASPTMTYAATDAGVILGTAAYMSPEQARGRSVDRRTDVWSFGCVLYECLAGRQAFRGDTVSDMVAKILEREPDWSALPAATPRWLRRLLERCLTKDVRARLQAIGEARIALERAGADEPVARAAGPAWLAWAPWLLVVGLGAFALTRAFAPAAPAAERRLQLGFPAGQAHPWYGGPVLSPDGQRVAMVATDSAGVTRVWTRALHEPEFRPINGSEGAQAVFWSPDSRALGFIARGAMWRVAAQDGTVQKVVDGMGSARGADWGANGHILYTPGPNDAIWSIPADGGPAVQLTHLDTTLVDASHRFPVWLPDGKHFLFAVWSNNPRVLAEAGGIYVGSTRGGTPRRVSTDLGQFILMPQGHLLLARNGGLVAVPFDPRTQRVGATATPIAPRIDFNPSSGTVPASASARGDIAWAQYAELPPTDLAWLDRSGRRSEPIGIRARFLTVRLAPDGSRIAAETMDATGLSQVWTADLVRRTTSRLTRGQNDSYSPVWSADGTRILFGNRDSGTDDLYVQLASGTRPKDRIFAASQEDTDPQAWSADGRYVMFMGMPRTGPRRRQLWVKDMVRDTTWALFPDAEEDAYAGRLSPDGRWLAYVSEESGRPEVYVRSFPDLERKWQISTDAGWLPHWRADGREIVFLTGTTSEPTLCAVSVAPSAAGPAMGEPQRLFKFPPDVLDFDCARDHSRFVALIQPVAEERPVMNLMTGWRPGRRS